STERATIAAHDPSRPAPYRLDARRLHAVAARRCRAVFADGRSSERNVARRDIDTRSPSAARAATELTASDASPARADRDVRAPASRGTCGGLQFRSRLSDVLGLLRWVLLPGDAQGRGRPEVQGNEDRVLRGSVSRAARRLQEGQLRT